MHLFKGGSHLIDFTELVLQTIRVVLLPNSLLRSVTSTFHAPTTDSYRNLCRNRLKRPRQCPHFILDFDSATVVKSPSPLAISIQTFHDRAHRRHNAVRTPTTWQIKPVGVTTPVVTCRVIALLIC